MSYPSTSLRFLLSLFFLTWLMASMAQTTDSVQYYINGYRYQKALDYIERSRPSAATNLEKGLALKKLARYQEAITCFEALHQETPNNLRIIIELSDCYQAINQSQKSQELLLKALAIEPDNQFIIQEMANSYFQMEAFDKAIDCYKRTAGAAGSYFINRQLARCYEKIDSIDQSIAYYEKALEFNPTDFQSTLRLANIYKNIQSYDCGIDLTEQYLKSDSANTKILGSCALFYFLAKNYEEAIFKFEKCVQLNDTSQFVVKTLGYSYFKNKDYEAAKPLLEKAFWADTTNAELCYLTGMASTYSVYKKQGVDYLAKSIELLTPSPQMLSMVYSELGKAHTGFYQYPEGLAAYLKAHELNPADTLLIFTLASHYDHWIKDPTKAMLYYQKFMETRPTKNQPTPTIPTEDGQIISYYDFVERRMAEIKKERFWE
jgi:tetratricopeptide (TPR) repeat protein